MFDVLVRNGALIDGQGQEPRKADIGITGDTITAIGALGQTQAASVVDAEGLVVAPGFIDTHSHSELRLLSSPPPEAKIRQGITTELLGQDGISVAPMTGNDPLAWRKMLSGLLGDYGVEWTWETISEYLSTLEQHGLPLNVAYLAPHGPIRSAVMGMERRYAAKDEVSRMKSALSACLDEGACGLSTGLIYPPCSFSDIEELAGLCGTAGQYGVPLVIHMRDQAEKLLESLDESLQATQQGGCPLHISHLKAKGRRNWPKVTDLIRKIEQVRETQQVTADQYPYGAGSTMLAAILPDWTHDGGADRLLRRLKDPEAREEIRRWFGMSDDVWENRVSTVGWENVRISSVKSEKNKAAEGLSIDEYAEMVGKHPVDAVCDLLYEENLAVTMITFYGTEESIQDIMIQPWVVACTDGIYGGKPHPRLCGSFPRILGRYVRERNYMSLPQAIRKMTSVPASIFGLKKLGALQQGYYADLVLFDPGTVIDRATYDEPMQYPVGIKHVMINGRWVIQDDQFTGARPGRTVRRS